MIVITKNNTYILLFQLQPTIVERNIISKVPAQDRLQKFGKKYSSVSEVSKFNVNL